MQLLPLLQASNQEVALLCEHQGENSHAPIYPDNLADIWCIDEVEKTQALKAVRAFAPDVIFVHGVEDLRLEEDLVSIAPSVIFVHVFRGTCISGDKARKFPRVAPCDRRFGTACLTQYFPRRCGGLSPVKMFKMYQKESDRLKLLRRYAKVVCASSYMTEELVRHGVAAETVVYPNTDDHASATSHDFGPPGPGEPWKLAFVGRMERLKGCHLLIEALASIRKSIGEIEVVFAGDGREFGKLQSLAQRSLSPRGVTFRFTGWLGKEGVGALLSRTHLLVFPSIWPEPFGLSGIEAGICSVPAVAFNVGGISEWLTDGVNGCLAAGGIPNAIGLTRAIERAIGDPNYYLRLRAGAKRRAETFDAKSHVDKILNLLKAASELELIS